MKVIYAQEKLDIEGKSIFLAGPVPRTPEVRSWKPFAISMFKLYNFDGTILNPELRNMFINKLDYPKQIDWEQRAMDLADIILFWIPRNMKDLPGLTTNIEFGYWLAKNPNKIRIGFPYSAESVRYIQYKLDEINIPYYRDLETLIKKVVSEK